MRLERVLGTNGIFVRTESGMKNPIGNKFFSPGELVCVDDNVVYGNENKVHSFTYTSNPMIEVFLSFEQEKTLDWNTFKYTCNKRTVKINTFSSNEIKQIDEVVAIGDFIGYETNSSYSDFLYGLNKIAIVEKNWYTYLINSYTEKDRSTISLSQGIDKAITYSDSYIDKDDNILTSLAISATLSRNDDIDLVSNIEIRKYKNDSLVNIDDFSSKIKEILDNEIFTMKGVLPSSFSFNTGTSLRLYKNLNISMQERNSAKTLNSYDEIIYLNNQELLVSNDDVVVIYDSAFDIKSCDLWGGTYVNGNVILNLAHISNKDFKIRIGGINYNLVQTGNINPGDTLNDFFILKNGIKYRCALFYNNAYTPFFNTNYIYNDCSILVGDQNKILERNIQQNSGYGITQYLNDGFSDVLLSSYNCELKNKLRESSWFLKTNLVSKYGEMDSNTILSNDCISLNIKYAESSFPYNDKMCIFAENPENVIFNNQISGKFIIYNKNEKLINIIDNSISMIGSLIKIKLSEYKKMLSILLAK